MRPDCQYIVRGAGQKSLGSKCSINSLPSLYGFRLRQAHYKLIMPRSQGQGKPTPYTHFPCYSNLVSKEQVCGLVRPGYLNMISYNFKRPIQKLCSLKCSLVKTYTHQIVCFKCTRICAIGLPHANISTSHTILSIYYH